MARTDRTARGGLGSPTVHNDGSATVTVRVLVRGDGVTAESVTLAPGESAAVSAAAPASVEVHVPAGSATAPAADGPSFVLRDDRVLVAPE